MCVCVLGKKELSRCSVWKADKCNGQGQRKVVELYKCEVYGVLQTNNIGLGTRGPI